MLVIKSLGFAFRHRRLFQDLSLTVRPGEMVHLTGGNGAGKSTLMAVVAGLLSPTSGSVEAFSSAAAAEPLDDRREVLEYVPAEANGLFLKMGATENLRFWTELRGRSISRDEAFAALEPWNLNLPLLRDGFPIEKFSTGMKRRLALARLSLARVPGWLLDEPVYGLDAQAMEIFHDQLRQHLQKGGYCLVISHDLKPLAGLVTTTLPVSGAAR